MAADDQSSLITALKGRDRSAWSGAVDRHLHEVYGFVFHLVGGDRGLAEDLNQEIWLEALDGIDTCDAARGSFRNWLFGIARKRVALHYRRRVLAGNPTSLSDQFGETAELGDVAALPQDVLEQVERGSAVRAAMLLLPDDRREALMGKYVQGFSVETIARRMGKTAKAVESLLSRRGAGAGPAWRVHDALRRRTTGERGVVRMSSQFSSDEEVLARLVREAGDPRVSPDPQYAEMLRATILDRVGPAETVAQATTGVRPAAAIPLTVERNRNMKRLAQLAVAATILVALGSLVSWIVIGGGSTNIAFAQVAEALDRVRSATYDFTIGNEEPAGRNDDDQPSERFLPGAVARTRRNVDVHGFWQEQE